MGLEKKRKTTAMGDRGEERRPQPISTVPHSIFQILDLTATPYALYLISMLSNIPNLARCTAHGKIGSGGEIPRPCSMEMGLTERREGENTACIDQPWSLDGSQTLGFPPPGQSRRPNPARSKHARAGGPWQHHDICDSEPRDRWPPLARLLMHHG